MRTAAAAAAAPRTLLVLLLAATACADRPPSSGGAASPPFAQPEAQPQGSPACGNGTAAQPPPRGGVLAQHVAVFGKNRKYTLVVPPSYTASTSYPLIYVLHGNGGTGAQARSALDLESGPGKDHAVFLYPDALGHGWDLDSPASKNADVAFFDAMLAVTQAAYCIDLHRVFVAGFSNGAYMANQLACRRGDRIRAVATHSGGGPYEAGSGANGGEYDEHGNLVCKGKPVGSLVVHGLSDSTVAMSEGQKSIDHWTHANHCGSASSPGSQPGCVTYQGCSTSNPVAACKIPALGHAVWGSANRVVWSFFDAQK